MGTVKKIKYEEKFEQECHNEHGEKCTYKTTYKEECSDKKQKVCEKFWKEDVTAARSGPRTPPSATGSRSPSACRSPIPSRTARMCGRRCASRSTRTSPCRRSARCAGA